jgi:hypothetical protein
MQKSDFFCIFLHWAPLTSTASAAIVPRLGAPLAYFPNLTVHLLVAIVAPRNQLDIYLRCHQSLIRVVAIKIQR